MAINRKVNKSNSQAVWPCGLILPDDVLLTTRLFNQTYNRYKKAGTQIPKSVQLTSSQVEVMMALSYMQKPMTLTEISPYLAIETASVSLVIDKLQKQKLVQRRHSRTDRRNIFITLTPLGKKMVDQLWPPTFNIIMDMFFHNLTDEERRVFSSILRKIRDAKISQPPSSLPNDESST
ncbi:MAG: MarR family transcriptional regulator [Dehalococcoidia bacterium]|nr:MarR family transcriptional regulator [Dehalococcoidia bacterium]